MDYLFLMFIKIKKKLNSTKKKFIPISFLFSFPTIKILKGD